MRWLWTTLLLAACALAQEAKEAKSNGGLLLGTWKLVSIADTLKDGTVGPPAQLGAHAIGFIMYEPDGHMCASIMNPDRPPLKSIDKASAAEKAAFYDTFIAYCGTYKLDAEKSMVTHYPVVAWTPAYVGSTQLRPFKIEGDRLTITVDNPLAAVTRRVLVWERAE